MSNWFDPLTAPIRMPDDKKPLTPDEVKKASKKIQDEIDKAIEGGKND